MLLRNLLIIICTISSFVVHAVDDREVVRILNQLDREIKRSDIYIIQRVSRIDSLKDRLKVNAVGSQRVDVLINLGDQYNAYKVDSALWYYNEAYRLAQSIENDTLVCRSMLRRATYLPLLLFISEACSLIDSVDVGRVPVNMRAEYYDAQRQMNNYISNFYIDFPDISKAYRGRESEMQAEMLAYLDEDSYKYRFNKAEHLFYDGKYALSRSILTGLIAQLEESDPLRARVCHLMSQIADVNRDEDECMYYLAASALSDIKCATLEVASLQELGSRLYRKGDIDRAHSYLSLALSNAVDCGVSLRIIQTSKILPIIEHAHKTQIDKFKTRIYVTLGVMCVLVIALGVALKNVYTKGRTQAMLTERLEKANNVKDVYISQFLNLCSVYMDKLTRFNQLVNRKISAGKSEELLRTIKSGKFIEEQSREFYETFDSAFLNIYPTFIQEVDKLLLPGKNIVLPEGQLLNTDLRILALMRLGIVDANKIAQMLNYSVATIYTYRNRFKARAIDRDTFEADIMRIPSIS